MELNPVKFIHLFMCGVWQEIYSLPIAFSLFLSPHFSLWADIWTRWGWVKSLFFTKSTCLSGPDIFLLGIISCCDANCPTSSPAYFLSPPRLKMHFYSSSKKLVVSPGLFVDFLRRYNNFLRDLTENTSPDNPEFQQLSSKTFWLFFFSPPCLPAQQTLSHPCDKNVDGFIQPGLFFIIYLSRSVSKTQNRSHTKPRLLFICLPFSFVTFQRNL